MTNGKSAEREATDTGSGDAKGYGRTGDVVTPEEVQAVIVSCEAYEARMRKALETWKEMES